MPRRCSLVLVPVLLSACAGTPPPHATPPTAAAPARPAPAPAPPPDANAARAAKVDEVFAAFSTGKSPGCSVGVYRAGDVVYAKGYGYANLEEDAKNTDTTPFYLASVSKQFTAAALLLLVQDGKVSLDDDVHKYVPELPDYGHPVRLAELMHHTSGVKDYGLHLALSGIGDEDFVTHDDVLWLIAHEPGLNFAPGTRYLYSNSGYVLLATVIARASGETYPAFLKRRIFEPLGMTDTRIKSDHMALIPHRAVGYVKRDDGSFGIAMSDSEYLGPGNIVTTVRDLAKWDGNFYAPKVGGASLISAMRTTGKLAGGIDTHYGAGLEISQGAEEHSGGFVGYHTFIKRYPEERLTVAVLCNQADAPAEDLAGAVAAIYLPEAAPKPEAHADAPEAALDDAALGAYLDPDTLDVRAFARENGKLMLLFPLDDQRRPVTAVGPHEVRVSGGTTRYVFHEGARGAIDRLERITDDSPPETFVRFEPVTSVPAEKLRAYAGRYTSPGIPRDTQIALKDGALIASPFGAGNTVPLRPFAADTFVVPGAGVRVRFEREGGSVRRMVISDDRAYGIAYVKKEP